MVHYARQARVLTRTIHERFRKGVMKPVMLDGHKFIDVRACPPRQFRKLYPPPAAQPPVLPHGIEVSNLRSVINYGRKAHIKPATVYHRIVLGQLYCVIADDVVFVDTASKPPESPDSSSVTL